LSLISRFVTHFLFHLLHSFNPLWQTLFCHSYLVLSPISRSCSTYIHSTTVDDIVYQIECYIVNYSYAGDNRVQRHSTTVSITLLQTQLSKTATKLWFKLCFKLRYKTPVQTLLQNSASKSATKVSATKI
jgi:hypothetical protein